MSIQESQANSFSLAELRAEYDALVARGLKLDLTRGKPSSAQLDLSNDLLGLPGGSDFKAADGTDVRNYGGLEGLKELREIFSELLRVPVAQLLAGDNSSLSLMHDVLAFAMLYGVPGGDGPWFGKGIKFLCPVPGYDRHFAICEELGIEMIPVALGDHGPDLAEVRRLLAADPSIKGMWVVPMYANPNGVVYDEATTRELVSIAAAPDFRIWWDNAYALHHLTDSEPAPIDVLRLAEEARNPDRVFVFASTSKITYAGSGVSFLGASPANIAWYLGHYGKRSIGPDKLVQLAHVRHLKDAAGTKRLMGRHRQILAPKFELVLSKLEQHLGGRGVATWTHPTGGYFVSLDVVDQTAARVVELAKAAGVALTPAGSAFPLRRDPRDRNIRLAPSFPSLAELDEAMDAVCLCVLLAAAERFAGSDMAGELAP